MNKISDERLEELIEKEQVHAKNVYAPFAVAHSKAVIEAIKELLQLRKREDEDKHTLLDSDLLQTIDQLQKENKRLIEDGERLANRLYDVIYPDEDSGRVIKQHNALMESIEESV